MTPLEYRAEFDADITFSNGGGLQAQGFRLDVPGPNVGDAELAELLTVHLGLLMVERVSLRNVRVIREQHKGSRGGPSDQAQAAPPGSGRLVDLSHDIVDGMLTHPGIPGPKIGAFLTREDSRVRYAEGTEFTLGQISMVSNTGTYLDTPYHRYADGFDLAGLALESCVDLPIVVVRTVGSGVRAVEESTLAAYDVAGRAVILHTGGDRHWGTPDYAVDAPYLTEAGAQWLASHGGVLVGIDSVNIDSLDGKARPAHSILLRAGIPIVEHLTGLNQLPPAGARFHAAPPKVRDFGTFPVRAYALVTG